MPKTTNPHAAKQYKVLARVYDVVAEVFKAGDPQQLRAEIRAAQKIWQEVCDKLENCQATASDRLLGLQPGFSYASV